MQEKERSCTVEGLKMETASLFWEAVFLLKQLLARLWEWIGVIRELEKTKGRGSLAASAACNLQVGNHGAMVRLSVPCSDISICCNQVGRGKDIVNAEEGEGRDVYGLHQGGNGTRAGLK